MGVHQQGIVRLSAPDAIRLSVRHTPRMRTSFAPYHRHRFPVEIISHCVWLYFRFALSYRDVEEMFFDARHPNLRNRRRMVPQVWPDICQQLAPEISAAW